LPLIQWTTVRLVVSENDGRTHHDKEIKLTGGEETYASHAETKQDYSGPEEDRTLKQWGEGG
jgi:hypothetical protein